MTDTRTGWRIPNPTICRKISVTFIFLKIRKIAIGKKCARKKFDSVNFWRPVMRFTSLGTFSLWVILLPKSDINATLLVHGAVHYRTQWRRLIKLSLCYYTCRQTHIVQTALLWYVVLQNLIATLLYKHWRFSAKSNYCYYMKLVYFHTIKFINQKLSDFMSRSQLSYFFINHSNTAAVNW
jgi:hypothetical protein